jgi:hypothetical protein
MLQNTASMALFLAFKGGGNTGAPFMRPSGSPASLLAGVIEHEWASSEARPLLPKPARKLHQKQHRKGTTFSRANTQPPPSTRSRAGPPRRGASTRDPPTHSPPQSNPKQRRTARHQNYDCFNASSYSGNVPRVISDIVLTSAMTCRTSRIALSTSCGFIVRGSWVTLPL